MINPYREVPKSNKPAPLRRWWQKSAWEWISFGQSLCVIPQIVKYSHKHEYGWAALYVAFLVTWGYLFFLHRGLTLKELQRKRDFNVLLNSAPEFQNLHRSN
jgi:hypothetical protein